MLIFTWNNESCGILTAVGSDQSSSDSDYEYYQTEIFEQLPSIQAIHSSQNKQPVQEGAHEPGGSIGCGTSTRLKDKESAQPLKNMAMCIQAKRDIRWDGTFPLLRPVFSSLLSPTSIHLNNICSSIEFKRATIMYRTYMATRTRRNMQISNIGFWESWRQNQSTRRRKVWGQIRGAVMYLLPWQRTLHSIKGKRLKIYIKDLFA